MDFINNDHLANLDDMNLERIFRGVSARFLTPEEREEYRKEILGDSTLKESITPTPWKGCENSEPSGDRKDWMKNKSDHSGVSKPSKFWDVLKAWPGMKLILSVNQLELWGVEP